jgi:hypothetical protein
LALTDRPSLQDQQDPAGSIAGTSSTDESSQTAPSADGPDLARLMAGVMAFGLLILGGVGVLILGPQVGPDEQPLATAGDLTTHVIMRDDGFQSLAIRNQRQEIARVGDNGGFVKFQPTARPADINGDGQRDLAIYGWTGGMHCCFTHFLIDGTTGALLGQFDQKGDTPAQLIRLNGQDRRAVMVIDDSAQASRAIALTSDTGEASPPLPQGKAIALVGWDPSSQRITLDPSLMVASGPDLPAPFWQSHPALADAVAAKTGSEGFQPPGGLLRRGDIGRAYQEWFSALEASMQANVRSAQPLQEPVRDYLDEMIYKGQASEGFARVRAASQALSASSDTAQAAQSPDRLEPDSASAETASPASAAAFVEQTIGLHIASLKQSPWYQELDRINRGALTSPARTSRP